MASKLDGPGRVITREEQIRGISYELFNQALHEDCPTPSLSIYESLSLLSPYFLQKVGWGMV